MKKAAKITLKLFVYGIVIPVTVFLIAHQAVIVACILYWGESLLEGTTGFKLFIWLITMAAALTLVYYLFCILFKIIKSKSVRRWLLAVFVIVPIVVFYIDMDYDISITICFVLLHLTYYALFFITRFAFDWYIKRKMALEVK